MNSKDFIGNYIMHDSLIDGVEILDEGTTVVLWIDFAFWKQKRYQKAYPETGTIKVTFFDVSTYIIPDNVNWNEISILESSIDNGKVKFSLMNDINDEYLEIIICSDKITVEPMSEID